MAASQGGVIRVSELEKLGVARSTVAARCREGGTWQRVLPGVVALGNGNLTGRQRSIAALLFCGDDALLSGRAALREYGYSPQVVDTHVLVPVTRRVQSVGLLVAERTQRMPPPMLRNGIRCAPLDRALLDAARRCTTIDTARALIADVVQRGGVAPGQLAAELAAGSQRGSALPRLVIEEVIANIASVPEAQARQLWLRSGLPEMVFNRDIYDSDGRFIARPDGWIDAVGLAWDIDSLEWHLSPTAYQATVERRTRMQNHGIIVLPTVPNALKRQPDRVTVDLRAHYALACQRPRPNVAMR